MGSSRPTGLSYPPRGARSSHPWGYRLPTPGGRKRLPVGVGSSHPPGYEAPTPKDMKRLSPGPPLSYESCPVFNCQRSNPLPKGFRDWWGTRGPQRKTCSLFTIPYSLLLVSPKCLSHVFSRLGRRTATKNGCGTLSAPAWLLGLKEFQQFFQVIPVAAVGGVPVAASFDINAHMLSFLFLPFFTMRLNTSSDSGRWRRTRIRARLIRWL